MMSDNILEMHHIIKEFPGVRALNDVNFSVARGEIHCLVGENGAGKSTLMKVLSGIYPYGSYSGEIVYNGETVKFHRISDSEKAGIAIINQELALFPELTIYENIFFGHEIMDGMTINWNKEIIESRNWLKKVKLNVNPTLKVKQLGTGQQQLVEIAKALSKNVKLLILDEPTSSLNEDDSKNLLDLLRELKTEGVTSIMISHRIQEVIDIAENITILRDGATICTMSNSPEKVTMGEIIKNMVGREMKNVYPIREKHEFGDKIFEVKNWTVRDRSLNRVILHDINLNVRRGEIVGLAGLMGAGRTEFALSVFGNYPHYEIQSGEILIDGQKKDFKIPQDAIDAGVAYVTEDRKRNGLVLIQDVKENIISANLKKLISKLAINENEAVNVGNYYKDNLNIKTPSIEQIVRNLSGGNQQKVSVAKWLFVSPKLLILDEPTRGIDVGAKYEIYQIMNRLVGEGMSILMISSELLEILGMTDRIYVMSEGYLTGEVETKDATEQSIMTMAVEVKEGVHA